MNLRGKYAICPHYVTSAANDDNFCRIDGIKSKTTFKIRVHKTFIFKVSFTYIYIISISILIFSKWFVYEQLKSISSSFIQSIRYINGNNPDFHLTTKLTRHEKFCSGSGINLQFHSFSAMLQILEGHRR